MHEGVSFWKACEMQCFFCNHRYPSWHDALARLDDIILRSFPFTIRWSNSRREQLIQHLRSQCENCWPRDLSNAYQLNLESFNLHRSSISQSVFIIFLRKNEIKSASPCKHVFQCFEWYEYYFQTITCEFSKVMPHHVLTSLILKPMLFLWDVMYINRG